MEQNKPTSNEGISRFQDFAKCRYAGKKGPEMH